MSAITRAPSSALTSLLQRLQRLLNLRISPQAQSSSKMYTIVSTLLAFLLSWRTLFFILAITNLKSLPLSWHIRLLRNMGQYGAHKHHIRKRLHEAAAALPPPASISPTKSKPVHPVFRPLAYHTHAPAGECDYNLHKSNSTYFSDLDLSRGGLMASLIGPALRLNALQPHGIRKGLCYPILGSVHTSFLREIKPYEAYDVRSRVLGWDRKWIVIGSWFVRKATKEELKKDKASGKNFLKGPVGDEEVVFACVLNKYVIKAGRMTVPPELCFAGSGWFPVRPEATATIRAYNAAAKGPLGAVAGTTASGTGTGTGTPVLGPEKVVDSAANAVQNVALEAGRRLSMSAGNSESKKKLLDEESSNQNEKSSTATAAVDANIDDEMPGWTWEEIEAERLRGLKIAENWLNLDVSLRKEYEVDMEKEIW